MPLNSTRVFMIFNNYLKLISLNDLRDEVEGIIQHYNPLINFRGILLAILGHVIPNRKASIRQYTLLRSQQSESLFSFDFL